MLNLNWIYTMSNKCMFFAGGEDFIRDLFLQSSPGTPLANFGPIFAFDTLFDRSRTLFCFISLQFWIVPKVERSQHQCPSRRQKRVLVKKGRRNSRRDNNLNRIHPDTSSVPGCALIRPDISRYAQMCPDTSRYAQI
jgi:hypothetical protein